MNQLKSVLLGFFAYLSINQTFAVNGEIDYDLSEASVYPAGPHMLAKSIKPPVAPNEFIHNGEKPAVCRSFKVPGKCVVRVYDGDFVGVETLATFSGLIIRYSTDEAIYASLASFFGSDNVFVTEYAN